ncbi:MarR family winged helix-turn-helix transcriptional regulator [Mycolicibacterium septicum]|uniref:MarR family winged helix-turn-helix transcriptional regulator n=1 Tax=Mycolicibacterium septicum TaxID=98668 RepID=A0ABW9LQQ1_9MYCO
MAEQPHGVEVGNDATLRTALQDLRIALALSTRKVATIAGLKDSDLEVLDVLTRGGPQSPTALARRLSMQPATMTGVLRRLEDAQWVVRRHQDHDRRSVEIESVGFARLSDIYRDGSSRLDALQASMTPSQVTTVLAYLNDACALVTEATRALDDSPQARAATKAAGS